MRTALRSAAALALAVPLVASALPASASSTSTLRERGSYADVYFQGEGTPGGVEGNYSVAGLTFQGEFSYGWVETFWCDPGETPGGGQEDGDCENLGSYDAQVTDLTVVTGKGKDAATTYSGTVDLYQYTEEDPDPVEPVEPAAQDVLFEATLTPTGGHRAATRGNPQQRRSGCRPRDVECADAGHPRRTGPAHPTCWRYSYRRTHPGCGTARAGRHGPRPSASTLG